MGCDEGRYVVSNFILDYVHVTLNLTTHVQFHSHQSRNTFNQNQVCSIHRLFRSSSLYCDDKNIYGTHVTIYLEREKVKVLGLFCPMGKRGCLFTFMVNLGLMGMRVVLTSFCDPFGWIMVLYILLGPSILIVCTFGMMTFILWLLFLDHWYSILKQLNFMVFNL